MWGMDYQVWTKVPDTIDAGPACVIELKPDPEATYRFWDGYESLGVGT